MGKLIWANEWVVLVIDREVAIELLNELIHYLSSAASSTEELNNEQDYGEITLTRRAASRLLRSLTDEPDADADPAHTTQIIMSRRVTSAFQQALGMGLDLTTGTSPEDLVRVRISRFVATELLNAMIINLGLSPGAGKGKASLVSRQDSAAERGIERYVNLWFTKERTDLGKEVDGASPLVFGKQIYLRVNIGPFDTRSLMRLEEADAFVSDDAIEAAFPETIGKPVPLEATIFSDDFEISDEERTQKFDLIRGQPTSPVYFPLIPRKRNFARLRLCIFYRNHLLQSLSLEANVRSTRQTWLSPSAALAFIPRVRVEMTFSADFANVATLPARGLWLGINQSSDTHTLNIKSSDKAFSRNLEDKIETALRKARAALLEVSFDIVKGPDGQDRKQYRFDSQNYPSGASEADRQERFRQDLTTLAVAGRNLYDAVFGFVPTAEEREEVQPIVDETKAKLRNEQIIQIARLKSMEDIWPWALMYDSLIDSKLVKRVCLAYRGPNGPLSYKDGAKNCTHDRRDKTVVCPYGFWGFKHIIEQPTQPGGKKAFSDLVLQIKLSSEPVLQMVLENTLGRSEVQHVTNMKALKFRALTTLKEFISGLDPTLKPPPAEPHVVYFFCHGKYDDTENAYLQVGDNESLLPSELDELDFRWTNSHGLVFINGCHTAELQPKDLSSLMKPFVEAYASGIIGTEISVTTGLAREFAQEFFARFLSNDDKTNRKVGGIIKDLRLNLLMKYNPLGLVYTPYCSADLQVEH